MGQQQLLLVILVTIIVGIATVVAINIFGTAAEEANRDAVRQDLLAAGAQAQGIFVRPEMLGGIGRDFANLDDIRRLNIPGTLTPGVEADETADRIENENGVYTISGSGDVLTITGAPNGGSPAIDLVVTHSEGNWGFDMQDDLD